MTTATHKNCGQCGRRMAARLPVCPFCGTREMAPAAPNPAAAGSVAVVRSGSGTQPAGAVPPPPNFDEPSASRGAFRAPIERTADQAPLVPRPGTPRTETFNRVDPDGPGEWPPKPGAPRPTLPSASPDGRFSAIGRVGPSQPSAPPGPLVGTPPAAEGRSEEGHWPPVRQPPPRVLGNADLAAGPKKNRTALIWVTLVLLAGIAATVFLNMRPEKFPMDLLSGGPSAQPCEGRAHCVVALLAPWDPASERSLVTVTRLQALLGDDPAIGLAVVIAGDEAAAQTAFAAQITAPTWFESGDALTQALKVQRSPMWWVLDARGRITRTVAGTYFPYATHLSALGIKTASPAPIGAGP